MRAGDLAVGQQLVADARAYLWALLVACYATNPERLAESLAGSSPFTLARICWGSERTESGIYDGVPFPQWVELAPAVLAAARVAPHEMLPQIAPLVVRSQDAFGTGGRIRTTNTFVPEAVARLFGSLDGFLSLVREYPDVGEADERVAVILEVALAAEDVPAS
jgi:hypothetical protein